MIVISGYRHKLGQTFTEPHGGVSFHIDGKRFKSFLQATDGKISQAAYILPKINSPNLRQTQGAHWDKTWWVEPQSSKWRHNRQINPVLRDSYLLRSLCL